uniref:Uncharacterized protein n=1 Tax=Anguilla anguilla TaxID=7936 RepID=A0A0E9U4W4_ANGAN
MRFGAWAAVWQCPRWSVLSAAAVGPPHPCRNPAETLCLQGCFSSRALPWTHN